MPERVDMNLCNDVPGRKDVRACLLSSVSACLKSNAAMNNRDVSVSECGNGRLVRYARKGEVMLGKKKKKQAHRAGLSKATEPNFI
jgi:hypothetical protein